MSREALTEQQIREAHHLMCVERWTYAEIEKKYFVSEASIRRYFRKRKLRVKKVPKISYI